MRLFLILIILLFASPAFAWEVRPVPDKNGAVQFCLMETKADRGRNFTLALSPADELNLGLLIPKADLTLDKAYDLKLKIDGLDERKLRARAVASDMLLMKMGQNAEFEEMLKRGQRLMITGKTERVAVDLSGVSNAFQKLKNCVAEQAGKKIAAAPVAAETKPVEKPIEKKEEKPTAAQANDEERFPEALLGLLEMAGVTEVTPLSMKRIPAKERPADFLWKVGDVMGGVRERPMKDKALSELVDMHKLTLQASCKGDFRAMQGNEQDHKVVKTITLDVTCTQKSRTIVIAALYYMAQNGLFTMITHEAETKNELKAREIRDGLQKAIVTLAAHQLKEDKK